MRRFSSYNLSRFTFQLAHACSGTPAFISGYHTRWRTRSGLARRLAGGQTHNPTIFTGRLSSQVSLSLCTRRAARASGCTCGCGSLWPVPAGAARAESVFGPNDSRHPTCGSLWRGPCGRMPVAPTVDPVPRRDARDGDWNSGASRVHRRYHCRATARHHIRARLESTHIRSSVPCSVLCPTYRHARL